MNIHEFYRSEIIRHRLAQYCGGKSDDPDTFTTAYLVGVSERMVKEHISEEYFYSADKKSFYWLLEKEVDLFRSVWDMENVLGVLDVEYFNLVHPGDAYWNARRTYEAMEPVYQILLRTFQDFGISPLCIMTGQGYHFSFQVPLAQKDDIKKLAEIGKIEESLKGKYNSTHGRRTRKVDIEYGLAFDGMGRLIEYIGHLMFKALEKEYKGMPVVFTDTAIGGNKKEAISIDLSMYGDPVFMRDIRCPFSLYQKHKIFKYKFGESTARAIPTLITLPRYAPNMPELLKIRTNFDAAVEYAGSSDTTIPTAAGGLERLINSYKRSSLYKFHKYFDSAEHDPHYLWPKTYDRFDTSTIPPCVAHCLREPNPHILRPTNLQTLTRVLMKMGWHPKHIAGLVRSKLERNYQWGPQWFKYDAPTRANFYIRIFSGLVDTGVDREEDLNCFSHAEKGYCWKPACGWNLADYRKK